MINTIPTTPATSVFNKEFSPNADPTVCDEISLNLTLLEPEFIKSTKFLTCSSVKLPWIITLLLNPWDTVAADKHFAEFKSSKEPQVAFLYESTPSS